MTRATWTVALVATVLFSAAVVKFTTPKPHPVEQPVEQPVEDHKGDRLKIEDHILVIPLKQPVLRGAIDPPDPVEESLPGVVKQETKQKQESNLCTRHNGRKVVTNNGKSWHCEFTHQP